MVFTLAQGFTGDASFTCTVSDGKGGTSTATVKVTVEPAGASGPHAGWTRGTAGDDTLRGGLFAQNKIYGDAGDDVIRGGMRAARLDGGEGDDMLSGGSATDVLIGGAGDDRLRGGLGRDTFVFASNSGNGVIVDFRAGQDRT